MAARKENTKKKESSKKKERNNPDIVEETEFVQEEQPVNMPQPQEDVLKNMNSRTKAAAVLIALGTDSASEVVKYLHEGEVETLSAEIAQINSISAEEKEAIINEFYEMCVAQKAITEGGLDYARGVLKKAFGDQKADELVYNATNKIDSSAFAFLNDADNKNLLMMLQNEHPQTIAVVLSHLNSDKASAVISELPKEIQLEVIERISRLERASPEVVGIVEKCLKKRMAGSFSVGTLEKGGVDYIADIMNRIDKNAQKTVFDALAETDPELVDNIKKLMFVFNDIVNLNDMEIQAFIRESDTKDLTVALKAASPEVQERIFANMSSRQKEMIQSDMQYLHNLRKRDVEAAQQRIIDVIRKLEESGDIVLFKGGDDQIIA